MTYNKYKFKAKNSTAVAVIDYSKNILRLSDAGKTTTAMFTDYSKSIVTVGNKILLEKLRNIGFRCTYCCTLIYKIQNNIFL